MKKRRHDGRRKRQTWTQKQTPASAPGQIRRAGPRVLLWIAGLGLLMGLGILLFPGKHPSNQAEKPVVVPTNRLGAATTSQAIETAGGNGSGGRRGVTNRPGAAPNMEAEGRADDLNNEGVQALNAGNAKKAIQLFKSAMALKPKDETFHFNLGLAFIKSGDATNAENQYKEALRLLPDYPEAHNNYGNLLGHLGRLSEAEAQLREALNEMPEMAQYNNNLGALQSRLNETNDALIHFQKAVDCDSNFLEAHFNLAQAYISQNQREKGIAELHEALRIKSGFEPAQRALDRVTGITFPNAPGSASPGPDGHLPQ